MAYKTHIHTHMHTCIYWKQRIFTCEAQATEVQALSFLDVTFSKPGGKGEFSILRNINLGHPGLFRLHAPNEQWNFPWATIQSGRRSFKTAAAFPG